VIVVEGDNWEKTIEFPAFHRGGIERAVFLPDNNRLLTSQSSKVLQWDVGKGGEGIEREFDLKLNSAFWDMALSPDGNHYLLIYATPMGNKKNEK